MDPTSVLWARPLLLLLLLPLLAQLHLARLCASSASPSASPSPSSPPPPPPTAPVHNVLMIAIDDMRPEMTPYGYQHMHTPHLQRLANRSVVFERAYVQVALCMPSRTSLLVSRRPDTTRNWEITPDQWFRACGGPHCGEQDCGPECGMPDAVTLPQWFLEQGFYVAGMGKIFHEGSDTRLQDAAHSWTPSTINPSSGLWEPPADPAPTYNGSAARPSWFAYDLQPEQMGEGKLALRAVEYIRNMSAGTIPDAAGRPFFLAVGFHKPHVPWYAPKRFWDFYPEDEVTVAPDPHIPVNVPAVALQSVMRGWATPRHGPLSCEYTDLCAELWPPRGNMTPNTPYDNTTGVPDAKARELRRAYWAALSFTDHNIGLVLDALDASPFAANTTICLWGDHGYALGDNDEWAKQTVFEHATRIPLMLSVPGFAPGRSAAFVEEVDVFPTLVEAATLGATAVPACPADLQQARSTDLCTEGFSMMPLLNASVAVGGGGGGGGAAAAAAAAAAAVGGGDVGSLARPASTPQTETAATAAARGDPQRKGGKAEEETNGVGKGKGSDEVKRGGLPRPWAFSQYVRRKTEGTNGTDVMGFSMRTDMHRYTEWVRHNSSSGASDFSHLVARELYLHTEEPVPTTWRADNWNVAEDPQYASLVQSMHDVLVRCASRPNVCVANGTVVDLVAAVERAARALEQLQQ